MAEVISPQEKSILVQIMNEVDEFTPDEKRFILYWLKTQKNKSIAIKSDLSVKPNNFTLEDIYAEPDVMRKEMLYVQFPHYLYTSFRLPISRISTVKTSSSTM
jgi:hypothetical protein